jgi:hypothetical protein
MKRILRAVTLAALSISVARAQTSTVERYLAACGDDLKLLCPNVTPTDMNSIDCLRKYKAELTQKCRQRISRGRRRKDKGQKNKS